MTTTRRGGDFAAVPELGYEEWRAVVRSIVGRYNPESIDLNTFAGKVWIRSPFGFCADHWDHNAHRIERTQRDVRLDDVEFYHAVFQVVGRSTVLQNDQAVTLDVGDVALVDSTRPVTFLNDAPHSGCPCNCRAGR
jgi:AraC family transcriptional regulator, positive regulator of tynA and feaB